VLLFVSIGLIRPRTHDVLLSARAPPTRRLAVQSRTDHPGVPATAYLVLLVPDPLPGDLRSAIEGRSLLVATSRLGVTRRGGASRCASRFSAQTAERSTPYPTRVRGGGFPAGLAEPGFTFRTRSDVNSQRSIGISTSPKNISIQNQMVAATPRGSGTYRTGSSSAPFPRPTFRGSSPAVICLSRHLSGRQDLRHGQRQGKSRTLSRGSVALLLPPNLLWKQK
jgi:hypothetical protein